MEAGPKGNLHPTAGAASAPRAAQLPRYFYQLSAWAQRIYLRGDAIDRFDLVASPAALSLTDALMRALEGGAPSVVERASQALVAELCRLLRVAVVRVEVRSVRPRNAVGELHGIFFPRGTGRIPARIPGGSAVRATAGGASPTAPLIVLWMRTAQRHDVVKPKTFIRTLMHELGHYLDYALLGLDESFHNSGFFRRESFLVRTIYRTSAEPALPLTLRAPGS